MLDWKKALLRTTRLTCTVLAFVGGSGAGLAQTAPVYSYVVPSGGYAANGNLISYTDSVNGSWNLGYDGLNRLTSGSAPAQNQYYCWVYDSFGNRTDQWNSTQALTGSSSNLSPIPNTCSSSNAGDINTTQSTNANNQIGSTNASGILITPGYDAAGNMQFDGVRTIAYDAEGRVCEVWSSVGTVTQYLYNAEGQRVAKGHPTVSTGTVSCPTPGNFTPTATYVLGQSGEQVTELAVNGGTSTWQHTNVYTAGTLLATYDQQGLHYNISDALGTKRMQVVVNNDASVSVDESCSSLPFGDNQSCSGTGNEATEHHFTGKERDTESGLDYFGARYYSSNMGRWMSPDWSAKTEPVPYAKLDNPQTLNLYAYVQNNPLSSFDVDGHDNYTYDQAGNQTSHTDPHGWWWHQFHDDNYTLNADNGKSYSLNAALTPLSNGQRYTLVSQQTTMQGLNDMLMNHLGSSDNHMSYGQAYDAGLTHAPQGIDFKNELNADFGNNALFVLGNSAHTSDYIGNIAWGAVMASNGFSETMSHMGAGAQQIVHDWRISPNNQFVRYSGTVKSLGDQPSDYRAIQQGYSWWNNGANPQ
jgi:RHS repeat-associated protein